MRENVKRRRVGEHEAIADQLLLEMKKLNDLMQKDRSEIEFLKAETARLEADNRIALSRLKARW